MIDYNKLLQIAHIHLDQAVQELHKCKDHNAECSKWFFEVYEVYSELTSHLEGKDND